MIIHNINVDVNNFAFSLPEEMYIDIRPDSAIEPVHTIPVDEQPALAYLASLGKSSQRTMYGSLVIIAGILTGGQCDPLTLPWWRLKRSHVLAVRAWLIEHKAPSTGQKYMAALRGVLKEAWRMGHLSMEEYHRAVDVNPIRGTGLEQAAGRALTQGEKAAVLATLAHSERPIDIRNAAIFGLLVYAGLRRAEVINLRLDDYQPETTALSIHGKGNKQRTVYAATGVDNALNDWIHLRTQIEQDEECNSWLFTRVLKSGRILNTQLTPEAVYYAMKELQERAGVNAFTPHDGRRTFAGDLLDSGTDLATVQKLMGHQSATTTAKYDRRGERAKQKAIGNLHMPYQAKFDKESRE